MKALYFYFFLCFCSALSNLYWSSTNGIIEKGEHTTKIDGCPHLLKANYKATIYKQQIRTHHQSAKGSDFVVVVEMAGVEPASESQLPRLSTSVSGLLKFPPCSAERQALHFGSLLCMAGVKA